MVHGFVCHIELASLMIQNANSRLLNKPKTNWFGNTDKFKRLNRQSKPEFKFFLGLWHFLFIYKYSPERINNVSKRFDCKIDVNARPTFMRIFNKSTTRIISWFWFSNSDFIHSYQSEILRLKRSSIETRFHLLIEYY